MALCLAPCMHLLVRESLKQEARHFRHTAGRAADRAWSRGALASCGMPWEPPTHASTSSCSGKPCAAQAPATEVTARMAAADIASALSSAAGCRTAYKQWQQHLTMRT